MDVRRLKLSFDNFRLSCLFLFNQDMGYLSDSYFHGLCVECYRLIMEQSFYMSARYHLICGETIQLWVVNQHDRVAERQGNVQVVCGKQDTFSFRLREFLWKKFHGKRPDMSKNTRKKKDLLRP